MGLIARSLLIVFVAGAAGGAISDPGAAQSAARPGATKTTTPEIAPAPGIAKTSGVWVEGPGFDVTYGATYDACAAKCMASPKCVMLEFYRPEKKCNLYDAMRPRLKGGSSDVGIKR